MAAGCGWTGAGKPEASLCPDAGGHERLPASTGKQEHDPKPLSWCWPHPALCSRSFPYGFPIARHQSTPGCRAQEETQLWMLDQAQEHPGVRMKGLHPSFPHIPRHGYPIVPPFSAIPP